MGVGGFVSGEGESPKNLPIGEIYPLFIHKVNGSIIKKLIIF